MGRGRLRTLPIRLVQVTALAVVLAVMYGAARLVPEFDGPMSTIAAVGFLLLAGMLASEVLDIFGLPHLTGYILAGIAVGPHVLHLVEHEAVQSMQSVNTLALSLIALAGGAELRIDGLRQILRSLLWANVTQSVLVLATLAATFVAIGPFLPFTQGFELPALIGVGLLWGVIAVSRSPSATLAIFSQLRPDGSVSRFSLAFVMSSDVIVILLLTLVLSVARPLLDPGAAISFADLKVLGHEVLGSVSLGTSVGLLLGVYLRLVGGHLLIVLIALGFGLTESIRYLHFDPLLAFLIAGFFVTNFTEQGPKLLHGVEDTGSVVFIVFFATAGAHLDIPLLQRLWPFALLLAGARVVSTWVAHQLGARLAEDEQVVRRWGWASLVSQAGLTLGLGVVIERSFPSFGGGFRSMVVATVAINELVGPVLFKIALDRTGESGRGVRSVSLRESLTPAPLRASQG